MTNILLSCENYEDKKIKVSPEWSFSDFKIKVKELYPHLPKNYSIIDGDFKELSDRSFREIQWSRLETWCLIRSNDEDSIKLDKPHYELMRYDVHPNALTQSGNYHFSSPYQAFCEFIDNSIQATNSNSAKDLKRNIEVHIFPNEGLAAIIDNGAGMSYEGLKAFATYFLSQADRGLEKTVENSPAYLDGLISKFGVGATQAGFYLGDRIKVITKKDDCPFVSEIVISKDELQQRAKENKPVFEDYRCIRNPGDTSTLTLAEEKRCLKNVVTKEVDYSQFTMVILTGIRSSHISYIQEDGYNEFCRNLSHVYHYYLFGEQGRSGKMKLPPTSGGRGQVDVNNVSNFCKVDIDVIVDEGNKKNKKRVSLRDIDDDMESLYHERAKHWFPFTLSLKLPGLKLPQTVQGVLMYFPHEAGQETIPREKTDDEGSEPVFECFWQGRLAPLSYVHRLDFCGCPPNRTKKQKDMLPSACFKRIKGLLFFNRHTPISNNKLKILLDERKDLSTALEDASTDRLLPREFRSWLEKCHRELDKELAFESPLPAAAQSKSSNTFYSVLKMTTSGKERVYRVGDVIKLDTKPVMYGKVLRFVQANKKGDTIDKVVVLRQPAEVYPDQEEERPIARILDIPDSSNLKKIFNAEKQLLPKTVRVYNSNPLEELPRQIVWLAGEEPKGFTGFWVKVFSGEQPPKPIVAVHQRKLTVKQLIEGPESKMSPIQNDQPYDGEKFGFKPFRFSVAGDYTLTYVVLLGDKEFCSAMVKLQVKANVAVFVRLLEPGERETPSVVLGEQGVNFKLEFKDYYNNPTTFFKTGEWVKLEITCPTLEVIGAREKYKANENGEVEVRELVLKPRDNSNRNHFSRNHHIRVNAVDVGDVRFPVRVISGPPHSIKLPEFETVEVRNNDEFPEFTVQVLDQWGQLCSADKNIRLCAECEGFHRGPYLAHIERGQATVGPMKVNLPVGSSPCRMKVKFSFVSVETYRRKSAVSEVLKDLIQFSIKVLPSTLPHMIRICNDDTRGYPVLNGNLANGAGHSRFNDNECLEISAPAGAILADLYLKVFDESGRLLSSDELQAAEPRITTSWSVEVPTNQLPKLPDCPVATLVSSTFLGNVTCTCQDVTCQAQIRIRPTAVDAEKWAFVTESRTVEIECGAKKQLNQKIKVVVHDRFGNRTECPDGLKPSISLDSPSQLDKTVLEGQIEYRVTTKEFLFTMDSVIFGCPGVLTLIVHDECNVLSRDAQKIILKPGPAHHIEISSPAFDIADFAQVHSVKLISNCYLGAHIAACVCDRGGNKTSFKTTFGLSWVPSASGQQISKKTSQKGEAIFQSNVLRCTAKADKDVKIKVSSTEHRGLQAAVVNATVELGNRIKAVVVTIAADRLQASNNFPPIKVDCQTEDGVHVDAATHLTLELHQPDGNVIQWIQAYRKPVNRDGLVLFQPLVTRKLQQAGQWEVACRFTEYRERFKAVLPAGDYITQCSPVRFMVQPADASHLRLRFSSGNPSMLSASSTADARGRTILPRPGRGATEVVEVLTCDEYQNLANVSCPVDIAIKWPSGAVPDNVVLPVLESNPVRVQLREGVARLPKLTLASRVGNCIGEYLLVFSSPRLKSWEVKFSFSTDEHIQKIQNELTPLRKQLTDLDYASSEAKGKSNLARAELLARLAPLRSEFRGDPRKRDVVTQLETAKESVKQIEATNTETRRLSARGVAVPARIRQYIKGTVAELAYVSDPLVNRLLSWFLQPKMSVALTTTSEQQRKVYDAGYPSYCEATLFPFSRNNFEGSSGATLPIELPNPPPPSDFSSPIEFAVNLLEFSEENARLRSSLYWAVLGKTIVLKDLRSGQIYREHLVKMKQPCPTILTRDGNMIASDGLMDPKRRCPKSFDGLKVHFGEMPPCESAPYRELKDKVTNLEMLNKAMDKLESARDLARQAEEKLKHERSWLHPRITALERELRKLRSVSADKDASEPLDKRRRR